MDSSSSSVAEFSLKLKKANKKQSAIRSEANAIKKLDPKEVRALLDDDSPDNDTDEIPTRRCHCLCYLDTYETDQYYYRLVKLVLFLFLLTIAFLSGFTLFYFHNSDMSSTNSNHAMASGLQLIYQSLSSFPFTEIHLESNCSAGFEKIPLGKWPGIASYCSESHQNSSQCEKFNQTQWLNLTFCVKPVSFYISHECNETDSHCWPGLCVEGHTCPVTSVAIKPQPSSKELNTTNIALPNGQYLIYKNLIENPPIGFFQTTFNNTRPCIGGNQLTDLGSINGTCEVYKNFPNASQVSTVNAVDGIREENWSGQVLALQSYAQKLQGLNMTLWSLPKLRLNETHQRCSTLAAPDLLFDSAPAKEAWDFTKVVLFGVFILVLVGLVTLMVFFCVSIKIRAFLVLGISIITTVAMLPCAMMTTQAAMPLVRSKTRLSKLRCFVDTAIVAVMRDYQKMDPHIISVSKFSSLIVILSFSFLVLTLAFITCAKKTRKID